MARSRCRSSSHPDGRKLSHRVVRSPSSIRQSFLSDVTRRVSAKAAGRDRDIPAVAETTDSCDSQVPADWAERAVDVSKLLQAEVDLFRCCC